MSEVTAAGRLEPAQHRAAKVVGSLYLLTMATALFAELVVRGQLVARGDAVQTAANIAASERLFRLGIIADLVTIAGVVVLLWGLYVILKPVNRNVALLAAFLRLAESSVTAASIFNAFMVLRLLSDAPYLNVFETEQLQALARLFISGQGFGTQIAFIFLGLGSTLFSYLWLRSGYIPGLLAGLGILGSLLLAIGGLAIILFPSLSGVLTLAYMLPLGLYEVGLGLWLLVKGLNAPRAA